MPIPILLLSHTLIYIHTLMPYALLFGPRYLNDAHDITCLIVTHDTEFMDNVVTDIIHYESRKLVYYHGKRMCIYILYVCMICIYTCVCMRCMYMICMYILCVSLTECF